MGFVRDFFRAFVEIMEDGDFLERIAAFVLFVVLVPMVGALLFAMVVLLIVGLCNWWSGTGGVVAAEGQAAEERPAAPPVAVLLAEGGQEVRVVRRRRAGRALASGEPGSSSGNASGQERE